MADKKITQLTNITGADLANSDEFVVVDITADETKAITFDELKTAFDTGTGFVRVTGDTMTGALNVESTITSDGMIVDGDVTFGDNDKAIFGAGSDLQIYSDGATSYIKESGSSNLKVQADDFYVFNAAGNSVMISALDTGKVGLGFAGVEKFKTTSTGIDVTGTVTADGLTVAQSNPVITITDTDGSTNTTLKTVGSNTELSNPSGGNLRFRTNASELERMRISPDGDISFYEDTGTTAKFFWDSSAESLGIGTTTLTHNLEIREDINGTVGARITNPNSGSSAYSLLYFGTDDNAVHSGIFQNSSTNTNYGGANSLNIWTNSGSYPIAFHTNNAERMRIDASGNIGIGTNSPARPLSLTDTTNDGTGGMIIASYLPTFELDDISGGGTSFILQHDGTSTIFKHDTTERMRIDSSGNVLVGKTSADTYNNTNGIELQASGLLTATRSGIAQILNREDSAGDIALFRNDGSTIGSIGASAGLYIASAACGLRLHSGGTKIFPTNSSGGAADGTVDLGAVGGSWKDAYLSGGVYLGGTGSANKLDDYEEGTWTPTLKAQNGTKTWTYNGRSGKYIKVGNIVTAWFTVQLSSNGSGTDGNAYVDGLPFTSANEFSVYSLAWKQLIETGDVGLMLRLQHTHSYFFMIDGSSSYPDVEYINTSVLVNDRRFRGQFTYQTS